MVILQLFFASFLPLFPSRNSCSQPSFTISTLKVPGSVFQCFPAIKQNLTTKPLPKHCNCCFYVWDGTFQQLLTGSLKNCFCSQKIHSIQFYYYCHQSYYSTQTLSLKTGSSSFGSVAIFADLFTSLSKKIIFSQKELALTAMTTFLLILNNRYR